MDDASRSDSNAPCDEKGQPCRNGDHSGQHVAVCIGLAKIVVGALPPPVVDGLNPSWEATTFEDLFPPSPFLQATILHSYPPSVPIYISCCALLI
jgi:hypothetical protein